MASLSGLKFSLYTNSCDYALQKTEKLISKKGKLLVNPLWVMNRWQLSSPIKPMEDHHT